MSILRRGFAAALLGAAVGFFAVPSVAGTPLDDVSGGYIGTMKTKNQVIDPESESPGGGSFPIAAQIVQEGTSIYATFLFETEEGDEYLFNSGRGGNGRLWLSGEFQDGFITMTAAAKGKPGKRSVKGKGTFFANSHYSDLVFKMKEGEVNLPD